MRLSSERESQTQLTLEVYGPTQGTSIPFLSKFVQRVSFWHAVAFCCLERGAVTNVHQIDRIGNVSRL